MPHGHLFSVLLLFDFPYPAKLFHFLVCFLSWLSSASNISIFSDVANSDSTVLGDLDSSVFSSLTFLSQMHSFAFLYVSLYQVMFQLGFLQYLPTFLYLLMLLNQIPLYLLIAQILVLLTVWRVYFLFLILLVSEYQLSFCFDLTDFGFTIYILHKINKSHFLNFFSKNFVPVAILTEVFCARQLYFLNNLFVCFSYLFHFLQKLISF